MKRNVTKFGVVAGFVGLALAAGTTGGAVAGSLITSAQIQDQTIQSRDIATGGVGGSEIRLGAVGWRSFNAWTQNHIESLAGHQAPAGTQTNWVAGPGTQIVDAHTVTLDNAGQTDGVSVQIDNLNKAVQANDVVSFHVIFKDGARCDAGSPRVFLEVSGQFTNSYDYNNSVNCANGSAPSADNDTDGTITFKVPNNGRIGQAGIVKDAGVGSVEISNLTVNGELLSFK